MHLPEAFCRRMQPLLAEKWDSFLAAYSQPLRRGLRINPQKVLQEDFLSLFKHILSPSPFCKDSFYLDTPHKAGSDPLHHAGVYYMQEPSAASAVTVLAPQPGERVLDLCAAPGGKTTQIAAALGDSGLLWSNEYVGSRAHILMQNIERWGIRRVVVSNKDSGTLCAGLPGFFDAVLVDAPCSGEGMFRKEPQALSEWSEDNIHLCAQRQRDILNNAAQAVRPGGRLVYSTCTFAPEENECVVADFLSEHPDFTLRRIDAPWGSPGFSGEQLKDFLPFIPSFDLTKCRRIFPDQGGEGHFIALLERSEEPILYYTPAGYIYPQNDPNASAAAALYSDCFVQPAQGVFATIGNQVRLLPPDLPDCRGLGVISAGIAVADVCKNRLEPCHAAFLATNGSNCRRQLELGLDDSQLIAFLQGYELAVEGEKGWTAVTVNGIPVGFGKHTGTRLKNRYPKGLRLLQT